MPYACNHKPPPMYFFYPIFKIPSWTKKVGSDWWTLIRHGTGSFCHRLWKSLHIKIYCKRCRMTLLQKSMHIQKCTMTMLQKSKYTGETCKLITFWYITFWHDKTQKERVSTKSMIYLIWTRLLHDISLLPNNKLEAHH